MVLAVPERDLGDIRVRDADMGLALERHIESPQVGNRPLDLQLHPAVRQFFTQPVSPRPRHRYRAVYRRPTCWTEPERYRCQRHFILDEVDPIKGRGRGIRVP